MEPCEIEYRMIPGLRYEAHWCVEHDDDPNEYDPAGLGQWVCQTYVTGKRKESRPQDAALRALEALSEALENERQAHHYEHDYALVDGPLRAVRDAVDQAIKTLEEEI